MPLPVQAWLRSSKAQVRSGMVLSCGPVSTQRFGGIGSQCARLGCEAMGKGLIKARAAARSMPFKVLKDAASPAKSAGSWKEKQRAWTMAGLRAIGAPTVWGSG